MITSMLIVLFLIGLIIIYIINGQYSLALILLFLIGYFIYISKFIKDEFSNIKKDRESGIQEDLLKLSDYNVLYKKVRDNNMSPMQIATFYKIKSKEYISLSGDYSNISMENGRFYKVKYYKLSGLMLGIRKIERKKDKSLHDGI